MAEVKLDQYNALRAHEDLFFALVAQVDDRVGAFYAILTILGWTTYYDAETRRLSQRGAYIQDCHFMKAQGMHKKRLQKVIARLEELGAIPKYPGHGQRFYRLEYDVLEKLPPMEDPRPEENFDQEYARILGLPLKQVQRSLDNLEAAGFITRQVPSQGAQA